MSKLDSRIVQFMSAIAQDDADKGKLSDNAEKQLTILLQERAVLHYNSNDFEKVIKVRLKEFRDVVYKTSD